MVKATKPTVSKEFKDLLKEAKKLKVDFDKETTEAELEVLVSAAKAAVEAQKEKKDKDTPSAPEPDAEPEADAETTPVPEPEAEPEEDAPAEKPKGKKKKGKEGLIQSLTTRTGDVFQLFYVVKNRYEVRTVQGALVDVFKTKAEGEHYFENLSRLR